MAVWLEMLSLGGLIRPRHVTLLLREDRADDDGEGLGERTSPRISRDQPT